MVVIALQAVLREFALVGGSDETSRYLPAILTVAESELEIWG